MKAFIKPLILAGAALLTTTLNAQVVLQKPVICDLTTKITAEMMGTKYQEKPVWAGISQESNSIFLLLANDKTGTWTALQISEQWACIVGTGDKFSLDSFNSLLNQKK
jgi:hypothetical protein